MAKCPYCGEAWTAPDIDEFESTWQQWRCGACGSWVDREATADELARRNARRRAGRAATALDPLPSV